MTTKEQERKALEQIKKIVANLGEYSYIGTAFEGCFEIAEQNIDNDWACSLKQEVEAADKKEEDLRKKIGEYANKMDSLMAIGQEDARALQIKDKHIAEQEERIAELKKKKKKGADMIGEEIHKNYEAEKKIKEQEEEIIRLKAKLYDLMVK